MNGNERASLVLVHGAWHGAWMWEALVPRLEAIGIDPHPITLPGLGRVEGDRDLLGHAAYLRDAVLRLPGDIAV